MSRYGITAVLMMAVAVSGCEMFRSDQRTESRPAVAQAQSRGMTATLTGQSEVPPVNTGGRGDAQVAYNPGNRTLTWRVNYTGLSGPATGAHFHGPAAPGANAPVLVPLAPQGQPLASPINGSAQITEAQANDLLAGRWYLNVHTQANPGGEIRGQVTPQQ